MQRSFKECSMVRNQQGFIPIGMLFIIALVVGVVWFFKHNKSSLPMMPSSTESVQRPQKLPPAAGVDFSAEAQTPLRQAQKYYHGQQVNN